VLPNPQVYLIPLNLDNTIYSEVIVKNPKCLNSIDVLWKDRWKYLARKDVKINIKCTKRQFMLDLDGQIQWWKNKYLQTRKDVFKNKWLRLCNDRLKILSNWRTDNTLEILKYFKNYRTLTFCNSIEHTEVLGKYCINSKNRSCSEILASFNAGKIKHITACNMLNEGINLSDCRIGIYAVLNSSEILIKQKLGRILRHEKPIVIIPYYKNTREEEIVNNNMLLEYDPKLVKIIKSVNEIVL
jgi:superfamily II DNA or RNA helicase